MTLLQSVHSPSDVKRLDMAALTELAGEIRGFLVDKVCRTGGHLGPNLGAAASLRQVRDGFAVVSVLDLRQGGLRGL